MRKMDRDMVRPGGRWPVLLLLGGLALLPAGCEGVAQSYPPGEPGVVAGYGYMCQAGVYSCRLPTQVPLGSTCSCPALGAPSWGNVH
ncbi:hypothetical protein AAC691_04425 [Nguyenibacter vanlangensis]|uniref:Lipoprotein n=1 Tax=Nguyenibacter vanlangensis TaxID=1216886 RepID=A0ABZ3D871_9PROT